MSASRSWLAAVRVCSSVQFSSVRPLWTAFMIVVVVLVVSFIIITNTGVISNVKSDDGVLPIEWIQLYCRSGTRERKYCGIILRAKIPICDASYDSPVDTTHTCRPTSCSKWATTFLIFNKSVISHLVRWQRGTARIRLPLRQQLIDISYLPGPRQQTYSSRFAAVSPCWGRQRDRQTDG